MPVVLIVLDGVADRPWPSLAGGEPHRGARTPLQAARTPNLDRFAAESATGLLHPLGRGFAPGSEIAHFVLFGYPRALFPGRAVFEALGENLELTGDEVVFRGLFSTVERRPDGTLEVLIRRTEVSDDECRELAAAVTPFEYGGLTVEFVYNSMHQGIVFVRSSDGAGHGFGAVPSEHVTDSDPYVPGRPVTRVQPLQNAREPHAARDTAEALDAWLTHVFRVLDAHPVNERRRAKGLPAANFLLVKWSARWRALTDFASLNGMRGASVSSGVTYKGIATALGMRWYGVKYLPDWTEDLRNRLTVAAGALAEGCEFVHVHTKAPDEAGHTKDPAGKRDVIEQLDAALECLWEAPFTDPDTLVIVTGDHGTPSGTELVHSGDPVPILMRGPAMQRDDVLAYDELSCAHGCLGQFEGRDLMPMVLNALGRIKYESAKLTPEGGIWWPDATEAMRVE